MTDHRTPDALADASADATVSRATLVGDGYHRLERFSLSLRIPGHDAIDSVRDVLRVGKVTAVLPIDIARGELVLIRQFRLPAHLGNGKGDLVEIVAGRVEQGETLAASARRECREEIGLAPSALVELFSYFTTPGLTDETVTVFLAAIDAAQVPAHTRLGDEYIRTLRVPIDAALTALQTNTIHNGPAIMALQWLALNRARLAELLRR